MSRAEDAAMRLYEDESLRADLTDAPAERLLRWAEDQLIALDETAADDAAFEAGERALRETLRGMNQQVASAYQIEGAASAQAAPIDEMTLIELLIAAQHSPPDPDVSLTAVQDAPSEPDMPTLDPDN